MQPFGRHGTHAAVHVAERTPEPAVTFAPAALDVLPPVDVARKAATVAK